MKKKCYYCKKKKKRWDFIVIEWTRIKKKRIVWCRACQRAINLHTVHRLLLGCTQVRKDDVWT